MLGLIIFFKKFCISLFLYTVESCEDLPTICGGVWSTTDKLEGYNGNISCYTSYEMDEGGNDKCASGALIDLGNYSCVLTDVSSVLDVTSSTLKTEEPITNSTGVSTISTLEETSTMSNTAKRTTVDPTTTSTMRDIITVTSTTITPKRTTEENIADATISESSVFYSTTLFTPTDNSMTESSATTTLTDSFSTTYYKISENTATKPTTTYIATESSTSTSSTSSVISTTRSLLRTPIDTKRTVTETNTTISPLHKNTQQVDGFLNINLKYFVIGCVFTVVSGVVLGVYICR